VEGGDMRVCERASESEREREERPEKNRTKERLQNTAAAVNVFFMGD
jgi:hypothetical protein